MKIKTAKLQEMLSKVTKGVGNNRLIPLTSMLLIESTDGKLRLMSTDATNYVITESKLDVKDNPDSLYAVVNADQFIKLISKLTSEEVLLCVQGPELQIVGNGTYKLPIQFDESTGKIVRFPDTEFDCTDFTEMRMSTIKSILSTCRPALATTLEIPVYTGYYMADRVVATDTFKINQLNIPTFNEPTLLSAELVDLLSIFTSDTVKVSSNKDIDKIQFVADDCIVSGRIMTGIEDYAIDPITALLKQDFKYQCRIDRQALLGALDRISLFVGTYDNKAVVLQFDSDNLTVYSKSNSGTESIGLLESNIDDTFKCFINVDTLTEQLKALPDETIVINCGRDNAIKLIGTNITQVIALLEE